MTDYFYLDVVRQDILAIVPPDGKVIGSIGCGRGATERTLVEAGREVHGVDVAPEAIEHAKQRLTSARQIGIDDLTPFDAESLDGLILADVLEHLPFAWKRLAGYAKMVKPGGWVSISTPNMRYLETLYTLAVRGDWPEQPTGTFDETHIQVMTHRRLLRWADDAGLSLDRWSKRYDNRLVPRNVYRATDYLTARIFHSLFTPVVQGVFRRKN
ncbi:MAG: methyltransferase domain-containing protein [Burkholderiales bacterium]